MPKWPSVQSASPRSGTHPNLTAFGHRPSSRSPDPEARTPLLQGVGERSAPTPSRGRPPPAERPGSPSAEGGSGAADTDSKGLAGTGLSRQVILFAVGLGATQLGTSLVTAAGSGYKHASELEATGASRVQI